MYSFDKFIESKWSLVVLAEDRVVFRSTASAIKPLIRFMKSDYGQYREMLIYDKYIGRAAALLMVLIGPKKVYTPVISEGGQEILTKYGIPFEAQKKVKYLMGVASDEMCRWEKMTIGKSPEAFWDILK
ncbi:MAG: DUF1893 domain-containing protein [Candidatus Zixiibacteriota bacterium]|nr:MAG: DUF1893 domain-containing protein [candidate division Zixibacteria bacterium]